MSNTYNSKLFVVLILALCLCGVLSVPLRAGVADSTEGLQKEQFSFSAGFGMMPATWYHSNVNQLLKPPGSTHGIVYSLFYSDVFSRANSGIFRHFRMDLIKYSYSNQVRLYSFLALVVRDEIFQIGNLSIPLFMHMSFDRGIYTGSFGFSPFYVNIRRQWTTTNFSLSTGILGSVVPVAIYEEIGRSAEFSAEIIVFPYIDFDKGSTALRMELYSSYAASYKYGNRYYRLYPRFQIIYHLSKAI